MEKGVARPENLSTNNSTKQNYPVPCLPFVCTSQVSNPQTPLQQYCKQLTLQVTTAKRIIRTWADFNVTLDDIIPSAYVPKLWLT